MMHDVDESLPDSSYHSSPKDDGDDDANPFEASTVRMHMDSAAEGAAERAGLAAASSASPPPRRSPHSAARMFTSISSTLASSMPAAFSSMELPSAHDTQAYFTHAAHESRTSQLRKVLGWRELIALGVGCTIGAGIFVVTGVVAATKAGPALFLCYIVSGIACALAGLCYSELASMAPSAGSAYSYARASLGQTIGWIIGWDLTLEYAVSGASVAQGWSKYFNALLHLMGMGIPDSVSQAPWAYDASTGELTATGSALDLPALLITWLITCLLVFGMKESARFANAMVVLKVSIVCFVIIVGAFFTSSEHYSPFLPFGFFGISFFGQTAIGQTGADGSPVGVFAGAAIVFFAYIGFDTVTCQAEETRRPQRDLPIGIIGSLAISTVLYVGVSLVLVGMVPYALIDIDAPLSAAFGAHGMRWAEFIIALGAIVGITSVLLVTLMGQPRILLSMARDGLLPQGFFGAIHPRYGTPWKSTILTGAIVSLFASLVPLSVLVELVSIGTLLAFTIVCVSILVLRKSAPNVPRPFRCPWVPYVPLAGAFVCIMLMLSLPSSNWVRLIVWLGIGMGVYAAYGFKNGKRVMEERKIAARDRAAGMGLGLSGDGGAAEDAAEHVEMVGGAAGSRDDSTAGAAALDPPSRIHFSRNEFEDHADAAAAEGARSSALLPQRNGSIGGGGSGTPNVFEIDPAQGFISTGSFESPRHETKQRMLDEEEIMFTEQHSA